MTSLNKYSKFDNLLSDDDSEDDSDNVPDPGPPVKESIRENQTVYDDVTAGLALDAFINGQVDTKGGRKIFLLAVPSTDRKPVEGLLVPIEGLASKCKSTPQGFMILYYGLELGGRGGIYELKAAAKHESVKHESVKGTLQDISKALGGVTINYYNATG